MKQRRICLSLVLGLLWLLVAGGVTAETELPPFGVFTMLEGQDVEVCEACLNAFKAIESWPDSGGLSGCERNYDSAYGFSTPQWTDLPPLKHLALLKQVMLFLGPVNPDFYGTGKSSMYEGTMYETDETFRRQITKRLEYDRYALAQTKVDIDNDGHPDLVTKYRDGVCGDSEYGSRSYASQALVVFTADRKTIDSSKTNVVMQNSGKRPGHPAGNVGGQLYDMFKYQGHFYFDKWDNDVLERDTFSVYRAKGDHVQRLCKYRYERRYQSKIQGEKP